MARAYFDKDPLNSLNCLHMEQLLPVHVVTTGNARKNTSLLTTSHPVNVKMFVHFESPSPHSWAWRIKQVTHIELRPSWHGDDKLFMHLESPPLLLTSITHL